VRLDPSSVGEFENSLNPQAEMIPEENNSQRVVKMLNTDGEEINIPADDTQSIQDALNDGFNEV